MMVFQLVPETTFCGEFSGKRSNELGPEQHEGRPTLRLAASLLGLGLRAATHTVTEPP